MSDDNLKIRVHIINIKAPSIMKKEKTLKIVVRIALLVGSSPIIDVNKKECTD